MDIDLEKLAEEIADVMRDGGTALQVEQMALANLIKAFDDGASHGHK